MMPETPMLGAIDMHAHFGLHDTEDTPKTRMFSGGPEVALERARLAGVRTTVVSAMAALTSKDPTAGNDTARAAAEDNEGLRFYAVLNPTVQSSFDDVGQLLKHPRCVGIKIHPREHEYEIKEHGQAVFEFSAARQAVVSTHSGNPRCWPQDFIPFMNAIPEATLIVAHLGHDETGESVVLQIEAIKQAEAGNVYTDTSSASSIFSGLIEYAVAELGADRIVFGTDSPCYYTPTQKARIEYAAISEAAKRAILWENAEKLIGDKL